MSEQRTREDTEEKPLANMIVMASNDGIDGHLVGKGWNYRPRPQKSRYCPARGVSPTEFSFQALAFRGCEIFQSWAIFAFSSFPKSQPWQQRLANGYRHFILASFRCRFRITIGNFQVAVSSQKTKVAIYIFGAELNTTLLLMVH